MSGHLELRAAPHLKSPRSVETIMWQVVASLAPIVAFFIWQYGLSAAALILATTASCVAGERLFVRLGAQAGTPADGSATITGLLLALSLPPGFPLWMAALLGLVAIALGKALFGGIGCNVFNPALVGRAFGQAAFPQAIAAYTPSFLTGRFGEFIPSTLAWPLMRPAETAAWAANAQVDGWTGATPLAVWKFDGLLLGAQDLLLGLGGHLAVGPSPALIVLCGVYLAARQTLNWRIPVAVIAGAALAGLAFYAANPLRYPDPFFVVGSGGLMLGAVYMATDMATSPVTPRGLWLYGGLIGLLTVLIRYFSGLPEGIMYAILIGNAATPLIERITQPRPFGRGKRGQVQRAAPFAAAIDPAPPPSKEQP